MNKILYFLLLFGVLSSCKKDCCTTIDTTIFLGYQDSTGQDLFLADTTFLVNDINIYYKQGNDYVYQNLSSNLDYPKGYAINYTSEGKTYLRVFLSNYYIANQSVTLIELKPNVVDTIIGEFTLIEQSEILNHFWYNGELATNKSMVVTK
jgi:hypothetical protein